MREHPYLSHEGPIPFAHRGGAHENPENTMEAFARAIEMGYRYIETDVHLTADGVLVAFHDADLGRVTNVEGSVREQTWDVLRRVKVHGYASIPRLEDLLSSWPEVRINIDCKSDDAVEELVKVLDRFRAWDRVLLASFSHRRLQALRSLAGPHVATALSPREVALLRTTPRILGWVPHFSAVAAQVPPSQGLVPLVDRRFVEHAHDLGLAVHVWTIDERDEMNRLLDLGVDGVMTDRPTVLKQVFKLRGIWPSYD